MVDTRLLQGPPNLQQPLPSQFRQARTLQDIAIRQGQQQLAAAPRQEARQDRQLDLRERQLDQQAAQNENTSAFRQQQLSNAARQMGISEGQLVLNAIGEAHEIGRNTPKGRRAQAYQRALEPLRGIVPDSQFEVEEADFDRSFSDLIAERRQDLAERVEGRQASKLSATSEKFLVDVTEAANDAGRSKIDLELLAQQYEERGAEIVAGAAGNVLESLKSVFGNEDEISVLRTRYTNLRNSEAVKNLPPGVASDRDIALALEGFLSPSANPETIASFLRGLAKLADFDLSYNRFASRFVDERNGVRGLTEAWLGSEELAQAQASLFATESASKPASEMTDEELLEALGGNP